MRIQDFGTTGTVAYQDKGASTAGTVAYGQSSQTGLMDKLASLDKNLVPPPVNSKVGQHLDFGSTNPISSSSSSSGSSSCGGSSATFA